MESDKDFMNRMSKRLIQGHDLKTVKSVTKKMVGDL